MLVDLFTFSNPSTLHEFISLEFERQILKPFFRNKLENQQEAALINHLSLAHNDNYNDVLVDARYLQKQDLNVPMNFDPRITVGVILAYLAENLQYNGVNDLTLPFFHWGDYANLSALNEFSLGSKKSCDMLSVSTENPSRDKKQEIFQVKEFCLNDQELEFFTESEQLSDHVKSRVLALSQASDKFSPGFHVFKYGGRSTSQNKVLHSKSYLNDFMETPLSLVLLLPTDTNSHGGALQLSNAIKININQGENGFRRLQDTNMFDRLKTGDESVNINVKNLLEQFLDKLNQQKLYQQLKQDNTVISYEKHLVHEDFIDNSTDILDLLPQDTDDVHLQNYKQGLDISLNSPYPFKYFFEAKLLKKDANWDLGGHYDWRFFSGVINYTELQGPVLHGLISAWFKFINHYHIRSWIAHGSLLSWYWNGLAFPWDIDFDVQMPIQDLHGLCRNFNQSLVMDLGFNSHEQETRYGRYFLDCGTWIGTRNNRNGHNNIDARFIDVDTGLYIDITGLALTDMAAPRRYDNLLPPELSRNSIDQTVSSRTRNEFLKIYNCKNNHFVSLEDLNTLKLTKFENQLNYIPHNYKNLLINEYQERGVNFRKFKTFSFIEEYQLWDYTKDLILFIKKKYPEKARKLRRYRGNTSMGVKLASSVIDEEFKGFQDYKDYLWTKKPLLFEYLIASNLTEFHKKEREILDADGSTENLLFKGGELSCKNDPLRHDLFNFKNRFEGYNYKVMSDILLDKYENPEKYQQLEDEQKDQEEIERQQAAEQKKLEEKQRKEEARKLRKEKQQKKKEKQKQKQQQKQSSPNPEDLPKDKTSKATDSEEQPNDAPHPDLQDKIDPKDENLDSKISPADIPPIEQQTDDHLDDTSRNRPI